MRCLFGARVPARDRVLELGHHVSPHHKALISERALPSRRRPVDLIASLAFPHKTQEIHAWLERVVHAIQQFSFVEKNITQRHIKHSPISVDTIMSYLPKLTAHVEKKVAELLPDRFAVLDGWSGGDTLYVAVFGSFPKNHPLGYYLVLLAIAPKEDGDSLKTKDLSEYLKFVLSAYDKKMANVVAIVGDKETKNKPFARCVGQSLVGCYSHRYKLVLKDVL